MLRVIKPKTRRARRFLENRAPKLQENAKKTLLLCGTKSSSVLKQILSDLHAIKKGSEGEAIKLTHKNSNIRPFEGGGEAPLEFLSQKTDCSLFAFGSHSKKRPNNLVLGRMFDYHLYDMVEVGVEGYKSIHELGGGGKYAPQVGSKPSLVFIGEDFETKPELKQMKSLLTDLFRGQVIETLNLAGLDRVYICVTAGGKVWIRHCAVRLKKSGTKVPRIELVQVGPNLDLVVRRNRVPGPELTKEAMKSPKSLLKKKVKNVSTDSLAGKVGRIYMPKQEVGEMALAKMKGLKRERREKKAQKSEASAQKALGSAQKKESENGGGGKRVAEGETKSPKLAKKQKRQLAAEYQ